MITLYQEIVTVGQIGIVGYSGDTSGNPIYIPVRSVTKKAVKFPDSIFSYEGWDCDYVNRKAYRWRGTEKEQVFYMDESLIDDSGNIVTPSEWLATKGNRIISVYYDTCRYCPAEKKAAGNPSGHSDNVWLLSYQTRDNMEAYLYEFTYDRHDNIVTQTSIEPRIQLNLAPGEGNVLADVSDISMLSNVDYTIDDPDIITDDDPNSGYNGDDSGTTTTDPPDDGGNTTAPDSGDNGNTTDPDNGDDGDPDNPDPDDTEP